MVLVSYSGKEINAKLVYYGPGLSGKTTNLEYIYGSIPGDNRGKMVSMKTKTERTLFFDFLPVQLGELSGFKTRFLLYTVPGQVYYNATRKLVLKGVDAVVFVADSKRGKMDENVESLENLKDNLREHGLTLEDVPYVLQYNKRDLPDVYTVDEMNKVLNPHGVPAYEAVAAQGPGVVDTFKAVSRLLLKKLSGEIGISMTGPSSQEAEAPASLPPAADTPATPIAPAASGGTFTGGGTGAPTDPNLAGATASATPMPPAAPTEAAPVEATPPAAMQPIQTQAESFASTAEPMASGTAPPPPPVDLTSNQMGNDTGPAVDQTDLAPICRTDESGTMDADPASMEASIPESTSWTQEPVASDPAEEPIVETFDPAAEGMSEDGLGDATKTGLNPDGTKSGSVKQRLARWLRRGDDSEMNPSDELPEISKPAPLVGATESAPIESSTEESSGFFEKKSEAERPSVFTQSTAGMEAESPANSMTESIEQANDAMDSPMEASAESATESPSGTTDAMVESTEPIVASMTAADLGSTSSEGKASTGAPREIVVPVRLDLTPEQLKGGIVLKLDIQLDDTASERDEHAA